MTEATTRERMIRTAAELFQRSGYAATSWRRLVESAGTPWGSAYHHFPQGKEQLGVAAIELSDQVVRRTISRAFERHDDPAAAIRWWFAKAGQRLREGEFETGCPVATIALEMTPSSGALAVACRTAFAAWTDLLADRLRGHGYNEPTADRLARAVVTVLEGALVQARVYRTTTPLDEAADQIAVLLDRARA